jgi:hypothetical protein
VQNAGLFSVAGSDEASRRAVGASGGAAEARDVRGEPSPTAAAGACPGTDLDGADPEGAGPLRLGDAAPARPDPTPSMTDPAPEPEPVATLDTAWRSRWPSLGLTVPDGAACWASLGLTVPDGAADWASLGLTVPDGAADWPSLALAVPGDGVTPPAAEARRRRRASVATVATSSSAATDSTMVQGTSAALPVAVTAVLPSAGGAAPVAPGATFRSASARLFAAMA